MVTLTGYHPGPANPGTCGTSICYNILTGQALKPSLIPTPPRPAAKPADSGGGGCGPLGLVCGARWLEQQGSDVLGAIASDLSGSSLEGCLWSSNFGDCLNLLPDAVAALAPILSEGEVDPLGGGLEEPVLPMPAGDVAAGASAEDTTPGEGAGANGLRHDTSQEAADAISKSGSIRPGAASGRIWLRPDEYASGAEAQAKLALNKRPDGYFEVPVERVQGLSAPSTVEPYYGQPGGGTEVTTEYPIRVAELQFIFFEGEG